LAPTIDEYAAANVAVRFDINRGSDDAKPWKEPLMMVVVMVVLNEYYKRLRLLRSGQVISK